MNKVTAGLWPSLGCLLLVIVFVVSFSSASARAQDSVTVKAADSQLSELIRRLNTGSDPTAVAESRMFGIELIAASRFEDAAQLFAALRHAAPDDQSGYYGGALSLFNLRQINEAESLVRAAVAKATSDLKSFGNIADSLVLMGVVLAVKGDDAGALAAVSRAVKIAPASFDAQFALGRALYGSGDPSGAAQAFRAAADLKPNDRQSRFFLASSLERAGDDAAAIVAYRELVVLAPDIAEGHLGVGVLLAKRAGDQLEEGIRELQKAVAINARLYEAQVNLGRALIRAGRFADAVAPLKRAAEIAPDNPEPHYQLAIAYRRLGQKDAATAESEMVKKIHATRRGTPNTRSDEQPPGGRP